MKNRYVLRSFLVIVAVAVFIVYTSCNSKSPAKAGSDKPASLVYTEEVFDSLMNFNIPLTAKAAADVDANILHAPTTIDKIAACLIKKIHIKEFDAGSNSSFDFLMDSIVNSSKQSLQNYPNYYIRYQIDKSDAFGSSGNFDSSKALLLNLEQYAQEKYKRYSYLVYDKIAKYYFLRKEPQQSLLYTEKFFNASLSKTSIDSISYNHRRIIILNVLFSTTGNKSIVDTMAAILNESSKIKSASNSNNYAVDKMLERGAAMIEFAKGNYQQSILISEQLFLKDRSLGRETAVDASNIGNSYGNSGQNALAIKYYDIAIPLAKKEKNNLTLLGIYDNYAEAADATGNAKEAYKYSSLAYKLAREIYGEQKEKELAKLEKDFTLKLKTEENKALAKESADRKKTLRNTTILFSAIALLLLFGALYIYLLFRQRMLKKQLEKTKVEQQLFRLQMNPHFMFNAIAGIRGNILNDEKEAAVDYLSKFSKLLRKQLENNNQEWISIENEFEFIRNYMDIQQLRYNNKFDYTIEIDESIDAADTKIPSMIVQPFIENSIEHGFFNITYKGMIHLRVASAPSNSVTITISDNGMGLSNASINPTNSSKGKSMAMEIVRSRLKIIAAETKTDADFKITEDNGVTVKITLGYK